MVDGDKARGGEVGHGGGRAAMSAGGKQVERGFKGRWDEEIRFRHMSSKQSHPICMLVTIYAALPSILVLI